MSRVLVTGATGNVGREVVRLALAQGLDVVAARREAVDDGARGVALDFRNPATWAPAFAGCDRLFLMRPPAIADTRATLLPFVDAARAAGIGAIVFLSVAGAQRNRLVPHRAVEDHLRALGGDYTLLRPGFFAQNLGDAYRRDIVEDDRIYVPAGRAPVNWIDARDIAEVAVRVLADPAPHRGRAYALTGPGAVPWTVVVDALSQATGRRIRYVPASIAGYARHLRRRGLPAAQIGVETVLHVLLRFGQGAGVDPTLARLLGRPPRSVVDYVYDHAALWRR